MVTCRPLRRDLAQQLPELALQVPYSCFTCVVGDDGTQRVIGDAHLVGREPVALELTSQQVIAGDRDLLLLGVPVEADDLHPVEQRARDGVGHVRGREEQHV